MVDIQIMRRADIQLLIHAHAAQVIQHGNQQILYRQVAIVAEQDDAAVGEGIFCQLVAQTPGGRAAKRQEILFPLTLQAQAISQFTLFAEQTIGFIFGAVDAMQLSHHFHNGRRGFQ